MTPISFEVVGLPAPQGSKSAILVAGKAQMIEGKGTPGRRRHKNWRTAVAEAARDVATGLDGPLDGPLHLTISFRFPMPANRPKRFRLLGHCWKASAPDLDKCIRSTGDALKEGGLVVDDARFARLYAEKLEVTNWTGAVITITPLETT